ncbi:hypothetical protein TPADAL_0802 [Treponema pallidum subsp. pallidum DAL-1]|uniref:Uncharacterized protein n=2 Tax=Treponema pallidum TaxID=160 RepID=A0AAU8RQ27_TREPL|nr:hypothetical protein TPESAMD_0802 [Treponema pallidum subsp. pertenue str. SamoaD]AEZ59002.1 hypothetical protein TPECDC2_0802 [Treponema pallidum subsp. pertenue str. CDC2]AEZ60070.1 hypothetical protein TPEGAU_0802 [Treponema pallidum subsp. pertenue str. Gauthier]AEZ61130.1 hypothetical protein TPADAL_0802 [Treponema pallidum subsp. pallidum DAL-1]AGK84454.1 hypothetical protein TPFB_0802 [Treponema pallidum str. Fribourg-Blanc]AJB40830.1 hypothetical protein TENDBA_0802 [Treponema palli
MHRSTDDNFHFLSIPSWGMPPCVRFLQHAPTQSQDTPCTRQGCSPFIYARRAGTPLRAARTAKTMQPRETSSCKRKTQYNLGSVTSGAHTITPAHAKLPLAQRYCKFTRVTREQHYPENNWENGLICRTPADTL